MCHSRLAKNWTFDVLVLIKVNWLLSLVLLDYAALHAAQRVVEMRAGVTCA
jgi:hypothetical protein